MGEPATKVDLLILGDGYTAAEAASSSRRQARHRDPVPRSPFKEHRKTSTFGACVRRRSSRDLAAIDRRVSPLAGGTSYDTFDSERYIMTTDNHALRDVASYARMSSSRSWPTPRPMAEENLQPLCEVAVDSEWAPYVSFTNLATTSRIGRRILHSDVSFEAAAQRIEPWEPNVTALLDPAMLKWRTWSSPALPSLRRAQGRVRAYEHDIQGSAAASRGKPAGAGDECALEKEKKHDDELLATDKYSSKWARSRRKLRVARLLSPTGELHHVHPL